MWKVECGMWNYYLEAALCACWNNMMFTVRSKGRALPVRLRFGKTGDNGRPYDVKVMFTINLTFTAVGTGLAPVKTFPENLQLNA